MEKIKIAQKIDEINRNNQEKRSKAWIEEAKQSGFTEKQAIFLYNEFFDLKSI